MPTNNVTPLKEDEAVKLGPVTTKLELNLGTVIQVVLLVGSWVWFVSTANSDLNVLRRDLDSYKLQHAEVHKDASSQRSSEIARLNTQIEALHQQNLPYRVGSLEAQYANTTKNMDDIKVQINVLSADQRLISQKIEQSDLKLDRVLSILNNGIPLPTQRNQ